MVVKTSEMVTEAKLLIVRTNLETTMCWTSRSWLSATSVGKNLDRSGDINVMQEFTPYLLVKLTSVSNAISVGSFASLHHTCVVTCGAIQTRDLSVATNVDVHTNIIVI